MTRLFIQFYFGVILILFVSWLIQAYVFRGTTEKENTKVIEDALGGGALLVRDELTQAPEANFEETLQSLQSRFAYPVKLFERSERPMAADLTERMDRGEAVLYRDKMLVALPNSSRLVELGPLPKFAGPTRGDVLLGLGSVFLLAALAIAVLLRPIARQFRVVERTALAIAGGDFSARIDEGNRKRGLPIAEAFNVMAEQVEWLIRSQKELMQAVSHELRTPLARMKFATELVRSSKDDQSRQARIDAIDEATDQLDDLVGELLDYTRYDQGGEAAEPKTFVLDDTIEQLLDVHRSLHPEINFQFIERSEPTMLNTYHAGLQRAIGNLIGNAGKYASSQVLVHIRCDETAQKIIVEDDGNGIAEEDRQAVFEPFRRLKANSQPGTGLGLALVRRICQRLGGAVTVDSSQLGGAKFTIEVSLNRIV